VHPRYRVARRVNFPLSIRGFFQNFALRSSTFIFKHPVLETPANPAPKIPSERWQVFAVKYRGQNILPPNHRILSFRHPGRLS